MINLIDSSNGIRFSISDLSPPTARVLPSLFQDRCAISLYDAQWEDGKKKPISDVVISEVVSALLRFKQVCIDLDVSGDRIDIVATEAARNAINSAQLLEQIERRLQWKPRLLSKEDEGKLGALGVISSTYQADGLVLDMGGGSVQLTHVFSHVSGSGLPALSKSSSLPLGAAALLAKIEESEQCKEGDKLFREVVEKLQSSLLGLGLSTGEPWKLYLTGGGLRGWGHILMSESTQPYPIPMVDGYCIDIDRLIDTVDFTNIGFKIHRISRRRATQAKAVDFFLRALLQALEPTAGIARVCFCQGGIREGLLYSELPDETKLQHPLVAATSARAFPAAPQLLTWLLDAVPEGSPVSGAVLEAVVNLLYAHAPCSKDVCSSAALRCTTTGILSGAQGITHSERALLALIMCERWGGDLPPTDIDYRGHLQSLVGERLTWWTKYVAWAASCLARIFPVGIVHPGERIMKIRGSFTARPSKNDTVDSLRKPTSEIGDHSRLVIRVIVRQRQDVGRGHAWAKEAIKIAKRVEKTCGQREDRFAVDVVFDDDSDEVIPGSLARWM